MIAANLSLALFAAGEATFSVQVVPSNGVAASMSPRTSISSCLDRKAVLHASMDNDVPGEVDIAGAEVNVLVDFQCVTLADFRSHQYAIDLCDESVLLVDRNRLVVLEVQRFCGP